MDPWQIKASDYPAGGPAVEQMRFLLRYAILAPSSNNSQSWKFSLAQDRIDILVDLQRWLKVTDPDQREVYLNTGCVLETLLIAAERFGYAHRVEYFPEAGNQTLAATVRLTPGGQPSSFRQPALFDMIAVRHTNHRPYEDREISENDLDSLRACCVEKGIVLRLESDRPFKRALNDMIVQGDLQQFADPEFRRELAYWIKRGVFATPWLTSKLLGLIVQHVDIGRTQSQRDSDLVLSSPVLGVLATTADDRTAQVQAGQAFARIGLAAATAGIWAHPMSQPVEIDELREALSRLLSPPVLFPQHPFRLGYARAEGRHTSRRELHDVIVQ